MTADLLLREFQQSAPVGAFFQRQGAVKPGGFIFFVISGPGCTLIGNSLLNRPVAQT